MSLVLAGGEVTAAGLEERVRKAQFLVFLTERDCLKGIAAVKNPALGYRRGVFQKARASVNDTEFPLELGWVFVLPSSRGAGFSHMLVEAALSTTSGRGIFATSRSDNTPMRKALKFHDFSCHGTAYASKRGNHQLTLFVSNAVQQGAPVDRPRATRLPSTSSRSTSSRSLCTSCGSAGIQLRRVARTFGRGRNLLVVEGIPMWSCPRCGTSYFTVHDARTRTHQSPAELRSHGAAGSGGGVSSSGCITALPAARSWRGIRTASGFRAGVSALFHSSSQAAHRHTRRRRQVIAKT